MTTGLVLGVLSRLEEQLGGLSAGVSSDGAWVLAAFAAGVLTRRVATGPMLLTAANAGYYGWVGLAGPDGEVGAAGEPLRWLALGLAAGVVFGAAGRIARTSSGAARIAAAALPAGVLIADGATGRLADAPAVAVGVAVLVGAAGSRRAAGWVLVLVIAAVAAAGVLEPLLP